MDLEREAFRELTYPEVPWFDYGAVLVHGLDLSDGSDTDEFVVGLCGSLPPALTFPFGTGTPLLTEWGRKVLVSIVGDDLAFREVVLGKAVDLEWADWPRDADEPLVYPASGEPSDYILDAEHSLDVASAIGKLWAPVARHTCSYGEDDAFLRAGAEAQVYSLECRGDASLIFGLAAADEICRALPRCVVSDPVPPEPPPIPIWAPRPPTPRGPACQVPTSEGFYVLWSQTSDWNCSLRVERRRGALRAENPRSESWRRLRVSSSVFSEYTWEGPFVDMAAASRIRTDHDSAP